MLDTQINMYSVDTGHFYSNHEKYLHDMNCKYRQERNYLNNRLEDIKKEIIEIGGTDRLIKLLKKDSNYKFDSAENIYISDVKKFNELASQFNFTYRLISHKREKAKESKNKLLSVMYNKMIHKENIENKIEYYSSIGKEYPKKVELRKLREEELNDTNVISVFESSLTRTIGIKKDELTDALMVVQVYYFDVFKDLSFFGFTYKGEKYRYFT